MNHQAIKEERNAYFAKLENLCIETLTLTFYGEGDEGQLAQTECTPNGTELPDDLSDAIEAWGERFLESTGVNWYDGDGGGATITFDVKSQSFCADVYYNTVVRETGYTIDESVGGASGIPA